MQLRDLSITEEQNYVRCTFGSPDAWSDWDRNAEADHPLASFAEVFSFGATGYVRLLESLYNKHRRVVARHRAPRGAALGAAMGLWSAYFFAKLLLYAGGYIDFSPWLNLAFAAFTALPPQNRRQRFAKNLIAVPLSIVLLYHDSWLPPISRALSQAGNLHVFTFSYSMELLGRFISLKVVAELALMFGLYALARRKLRLSTFVFIAILLILLVPRDWPLQSSSVVATAGASVPGAPPPEADPTQYASGGTGFSAGAVLCQRETAPRALRAAGAGWRAVRHRDSACVLPGVG